MKTILVLSKTEAQARDLSCYHVISIRNVGDVRAQLHNPASVLWLEFNDDVHGQNTITKTDAEAIVGFVAGLQADARIIVHCEAGVSRSAGVADALMTLKVVTWVNVNERVWSIDEYWISRFHPNPVVKHEIISAWLRRSD